MQHIPAQNPSETTGAHKSLFDKIDGAFGKVPNMFKTIGQSPVALEAMWGFFGALGKGKLGAKLGEQIAVHVADLNRCEYCLAAHTALGQGAGVSAQEMKAAQAGESKDPRTQAALRFVGALVTKKGLTAKSDVDAVRAAGFSDEEISELLAHTALNIFTNYTNNAFAVEVDFPKVELR
jgi:uncharacterized peroxidase-related enzyme